MANALFVSEAWLKKNTAISANLDVTELLPFITEAQDQFVQDITGTTLYEALKVAVIAGTLSSDQTALMNLIRPALAWYAVYKALPFLNWKIKQKSVLRGTGEGVNAAELNELKYLRDETKTNAEFHGQRVVDYLRRNVNLFPEYRSPGNTDIYPTQSAYKLGIGFDMNEMSKEDREFYRRYLS